MKMDFNIKNMSCSGCAANVERTVSGLKGVSKTEVRLATGDMTVEFDEKAITAKEIINVVSKSGYPASEKRG